MCIRDSPWDSTQIDTFFTDSGFVSADLVGCAIDSVRVFVVGDGFIFAFDFRGTYARYWSYMHTPGASYHFAALEDSFLYTWTPGDLVCINVADPESIFIYRTYSPIGGNSGLVVRDGYAYLGRASTFDDDSTFRAWPEVGVAKIDMVNSATPVNTFGGYYCENRFFGDLATDGDFVFHVNTEMSDGPAWTIGESYLYVLGTDTSYNFVSHWDGQGVFSIDVIDTHLVVAGFEYGFSILNISNLDSIYEAAYYMDDTGNMDLTHFAMKDNRLYAMGHPRDGYATLYMFKLDDCVITGQCEVNPLPKEFEFFNYPNPFNSSCKFAFSGVSQPIEGIDIYDINGRLVEEILDSRFHGNDNEYIWTPVGLPSGIYLARITAGNESFTTKIVYLQ